MPRFVAFLRAVNVGGHFVKMDALKSHFEAMGFTDVETFIASGNVVFSLKGVKGLDGKIAAVLGRALGYEVKTFVRTVAEVVDAAAQREHDSEDGGAVRSRVKAALSRREPHLIVQTWPVEVWAAISEEFETAA